MAFVNLIYSICVIANKYNSGEKVAVKRILDEGLKYYSLLENQIATFNNNFEEVHISMKHLLEVASRVYELYMSSDIDRKRKILKLVFPNIWLDGQKLLYEIKKPFDEFIKQAYYLLNWRLGDSNS